jgi:hypothetical protein
MRFLLIMMILAVLTACSKSDSGANAPICSDVPASAGLWVPSVTGASSSNHDAGVTVTTTTTSYTGTLVGLAQGLNPSPTTGNLASVSIDMTQDLGAHGSLTIQAVGTSVQSQVQGTATPFLVSLSDGVHEYVNLPMAGGGAGDCGDAGIYTCTSATNCDVNPTCTPGWPSAYTSRDQWEQHQLINTAGGFPSVNTFPTCNWSTNPAGHIPGTDAPGNFLKCPFSEATVPVGGTPWLSAGKLPTGTYTAKFALVATGYRTFSAPAPTGTFDVTVIKKKTGATLSAAVDLNVVLVGTNNVTASHTTKGQQNLNSLFAQVAQYYNQSGVGIRLGSINVIDWPCDGYANVGTSGLSDLFTNGARVLPAGTAGKALNIFLTSTIQNDVAGLGSGVVIDGYSGGIGGPVTNGTPASGLVFATFDRIGPNAGTTASNPVFNPNCASSSNPCSLTEVDAAFWNMETTIAHEMGHFLGLNHPSESDGTVHDQLYDTPVCTAVNASIGALTIGSCLNTDTTDQHFSNAVPTPKSCHNTCTSYNSGTTGLNPHTYCPTIQECQFNHIMWYTSKNFADAAPNLGSGDGNLFSNESGVLLNLSPFVQ